MKRHVLLTSPVLLTLSAALTEPASAAESVEAFIEDTFAELGCAELMDTLAQPLDSTPLYARRNGICGTADLSPAGETAYFSDPACTLQVAFRPEDVGAFCRDRFLEGAASRFGNAGAWEPDTRQPSDPLPAVASLPWTAAPGARIHIGVLPLEGNRQPYVKRLHYRTVEGIGRGEGRCELEMRVYKRDIAERGLIPLLAFHGGSWRHRRLPFLGLEMLTSHFTERGFIVFAPAYRLVGENDGNVECNGADWRALTEDVEAALSWVSRHGAALGAASSPVRVYGQSAGAHLAAWLAAHRATDVGRALLYYGPTDFLQLMSRPPPLPGPVQERHHAGLASLAGLFGAQGGAREARLQQIELAGVTPEALADDWETLIPGTVFDLTEIDPRSPPGYVRRCVQSTGADLAAINPVLPPRALISCLKRELSDFLIQNSLHGILAAETVPIHVVHGSADSVVPHSQALALCGAIDGSTPGTDVIDELTTFPCGAQSRVQIVKDAEHALEVGLCLGTLCPAGPEGSRVRGAAATAIRASYAWLSEDAAAAETEASPSPTGGSGTVGWMALLGLAVAWYRRSRRTYLTVSESMAYP